MFPCRPVGLVRTQNLQFLKKEKTHLSELPHPAPKGSLPSAIESEEIASEMMARNFAMSAAWGRTDVPTPSGQVSF
jgi:hypothetical protein